jgi:hypothetical protein
MSQPSCSRWFEADAIEDRRLAGADRASFERHVSSCTSCARRVRMLTRVRELATHLPDAEASPLERRRMRSTLLRKANDVTLRQPEPRRIRSWAVALAAVLLVALAIAAPFAIARRNPSPPPVAATEARVPTFRMDAATGSEWNVLERSTTLRLGIRSGGFDLSVDKLAPDQRFLLDLPDGELEVKGTKFHVEANAGRTRRVSVSEGRVELRFRGRAPISLGVDEAWTEPVTPSAVPPASSVAPALRSTPAPPSSSSAAPTPRGTAGQEFSKAMAAFTAGDYGSAEQLFVAFETAHPNDQRVEDATFLRAVARSRRGDRAGASQLAAEYLRRYPKGLRRFEAEELRGP